MVGRGMINLVEETESARQGPWGEGLQKDKRLYEKQLVWREKNLIESIIWSWEPWVKSEPYH